MVARELVQPALFDPAASDGLQLFRVVAQCHRGKRSHIHQQFIRCSDVSIQTHDRLQRRPLALPGAQVSPVLHNRGLVRIERQALPHDTFCDREVLLAFKQTTYLVQKLGLFMGF